MGSLPTMPQGPIPPQLAAAAMQRPGGAPMPGTTNPLAALAQRGAPGQGAPPQQMAMLMFLAGMGFPEFAKSMSSMRPKESHKGGATGLRADAMRSPQQAMIPPQLLQAALAGGGAPGGMPPGMSA